MMQTIIRNENAWHTITTLERCLTLVSVIACLAVIGSVGAAAPNRIPVNDKDKDSIPKKVCLTAECVHTASAVLNKMKTDIKPCDDFYQFACGNFIDETEIEGNSAYVDILSIVTGKVRRQLKHIIQEERLETDPKHIRLPNSLYKACMNEDLIESLGTRAIQQISNSLGGWPVIVGNSWDSQNAWSWQETVKKLKHLGFDINNIIHFTINEDLKNGSRYIIGLDQSATGLNRAYLINGFNDTLVSAYYDYMVDLAVLFGAEKTAAKMELREALQFEMDLAKSSWPIEKRRNINDLYNLRSIKQLQETYPYVQWLDYINGILPEGVQVDENEIINLAVPSFFEDLGKILQRTNKRAIANYLMWLTHEASVQFLNNELRTRQYQYVAAFSGQQQQQARLDSCINMVSQKLEVLVGFLYVRKHFDQASKTTVLKMVNNLREVFSKILDEAEWMDDKTKQQAKKKLYAMTPYIGYPDELLDSNKLEALYINVDINPAKYFESVMAINIFEMDFQFSKLRLPVNKTDWIRHSHPAVVNAFYTPTENSIHLPAAILQDRLFHPERPMYMNYGAIGYIVGHEITHGFDDEGRQYDTDGNLRDWWQPDTKKSFLDKAQCIIEQYGNCTDKQTGLNLNGINTQGENIADNGGIKQAYVAYKTWVAKNGVEPTLPALNYTPQQLFWISAAQTWCAVYRKEALSLLITTNVHSTNEFRVLGSLRNVKDFARDFQCNEGAPMNPVHKCHVW